MTLHLLFFLNNTYIDVHENAVSRQLVNPDSPMPMTGGVGALAGWGAALDPIATAGVGAAGAVSGFLCPPCSKVWIIH